VKIAYIAAGAAGMYCGNCLRDHALALAMRDLDGADDVDLTLVPTYTPLLTDSPQGDEVRGSKLFFNGVRTYLAQKARFFRTRRAWLDRVFGSRYLLGTLSRMQASTDPSKLGDITVSMLRGEDGHQSAELDELASWLHGERPDLVHLSNALLLGMVRRIKDACGAPIVCSLQSEDIFVEGLVEPYRRQALELIRDRAADVDAFVSVSHFYAEYCATHFGIEPDRIRVVHSGVAVDEHQPAPFRSASDELTIGFLARMAPEKGLGSLCAAFEMIARRPGMERVRLKAAGYLPNSEVRWLATLRRHLARAGLGARVELLGTVDRTTKLDFLSQLDVLALPTRRAEPKGLSIFEALASGLPLVLPDHGTFPEIVEKSGAGVLHAPNDVEHLAAQLERVLLDEELRRKLGVAARRSAQEHFHSARMAAETLDVYRRVLDQPS